jgi:hypothetical protein
VVRECAGIFLGKLNARGVAVANPPDVPHPRNDATDDERPVRATWNRQFWGFHILAFADDHTYLIQFGSPHTHTHTAWPSGSVSLTDEVR